MYQESSLDLKLNQLLYRKIFTRKNTSTILC